MVNLGAIISILLVAGFFLAGGNKLIRPAIVSSRQTVQFLQTSVSERGQNVSEKTQMAMKGETVG